MMMQAPIFVLGFIFFLFIIAIIAYLIHVFVREEREEQDFFDRGSLGPARPGIEQRPISPQPPATYTEARGLSDETVLQDLAQRLERLEKEIVQLGRLAEESKTPTMPSLTSKITPTIETYTDSEAELVYKEPKDLERIAELEGELEAVQQLLDELEERREQKEISEDLYKKLRKKYLGEQKSIKSEIKKLSESEK
ncbi:MAG: hypothetical protein ACFE7E_05785 [Candidatus Hodarchaeota archaeon]